MVGERVGQRKRLVPTYVWVIMVLAAIVAAVLYFKPFGIGARNITPEAPAPPARVEQPVQPKAARPPTPRQAAPAPAPVATPAPAPAVAATQPPLPAPLPAVNADTQRLVDLVKQRRPSPNGGGSVIRLVGNSGAIYEIIYNGDALSPERRAIMIRDLPAHGAAHDPLSLVNLNAMLVWDFGLDGAVDSASNGSPFAALPQERQTRYQRAIAGVQEALGLENEAAFQARYEAMRADILARADRDARSRRPSR